MTYYRYGVISYQKEDDFIKRRWRTYHLLADGERDPN